MCERLAVKRGFIHAVAVVVVLGILAFVSLPYSSAGESKSIPQKIRTAKTSADQQALATIFQKEAQVAQRQATRHLQMKEAYAAVPTLGPDATGVGHVLWYVVAGKGYSLRELRSFQD